MLIHSVIKPFWKNKLIVSILLVEIALAFAVIANTAQIVRERFSLVRLDTGLDEENLFVVEIGRVGISRVSRDDILQNIAAARAIPGVVAASAINSVPLGGGEWTVSISDKPGSIKAPIEVAEYVVAPAGLDALGLNLLSGRDFAADDYVGFENSLPSSPTILLTKKLAKNLFGTEQVVGRLVYLSGQPKTVIGVISGFIRPSLQGKEASHNSVVLAGLPGPNLEKYLAIRFTGDASNLSGSLSDGIKRVRSDQYVSSVMSFSERKHIYQSNDRYLISVMSVASLIALLVGAFGIYALSSLWVRQRKASMGIRRMLGATRLQILQFVLLENLTLTLSGCVLGVLLAYFLNGISMSVYQMGELSISHLLLCSMVLVLIGQVAVWVPARKVAECDPVDNLR